MNVPELTQRIERSRLELLDLSKRNRLLSCSTSSRVGLRIVDEIATEISHILVQQGRVMSFLAGRGEAESEDLDFGAPLGQPDVGDDTDPNRHTDSKLQTALTDDQLQRKLLRLYGDSKALLEEQGINTLYLALGFLHWRESDREDRFRRAPLVLIPVELERTSVQARFRLKYTGEDISSNLTLEEKLRSDFGFELPPFPESEGLLSGCCESHSRTSGLAS